jgi:hypothetical protein
MSGQGLEALARFAVTAVSRRTSLLALGGTAMAIAATPTVTSAGKAGKKAKQRCKRQGKQCRNVLAAECGNDQECLDEFLRCCGPFSRCQARQGFNCLAGF